MGLRGDKNLRSPRVGLVLVAALMLLLCFCSVAFGETAPAKPLDKPIVNQALVYQLDVSGEINGALEKYVKRGYATAEADHAAYMILVLDTYGGYVDNAVQIKQTIMSSPIKTICYINDKAISAGALIALSCKSIAMAPGSTMGAAEPRNDNVKADEKVVSFWSAELASAAEQNGRNGQIAAAMADSDIAIEGIIEKGKLLTLTTAQALDLGMADLEVVNLQLLLEANDLDGSVVIQVEPDFKEQIAGFLSNPVVSSILLTVGIGALVLELMFAGFGVAGCIGLVALALYFTGGLLVGYSGWLALVLLVLAAVLLAVEIFVIPGFGAAGILGVLCLLGAIVAVAPTLSVALWQLVIAVVVVIILVMVSIKTGKTRKIWSKLVLREKTSTAEGYVSQGANINTYLGMEGVTLTALRPAGAVKIGEERVDVLTEGDFISVGEKVVVVKVDGSSVVVRKL